MATMLLRRATQVVNRIQREAAFEIEKEDDDLYYGRRRKKTTQAYTAITAVNIDGNPSGRVDSSRDTLLARLDRTFRLMQIGTSLRQEIAKKQNECGVTALVTERVAVVRTQHILETLLEEIANSVYVPDEFSQQVMAARTRFANAQQAQAVATITTAILKEEDRAKLRQQLIGIKKRLLDIDDRLAELNATNAITISNESEQYLQEIGVA